MNNEIVSEEKKKPVLDEQTLAKLLEAAYVLQEHNREMRELELGLDLKRDKIEAQEKASAPVVKGPQPAPPAPADYTFTLAQIVATQHQIQIRNLELDKAMSLVTERVTEIARANGAAIGIVTGKKVRYRAVFGALTWKAGTEVPTESALCQPCIRNAQVFRCADVNPEFLVDTEECRRRGIQSLIAVPIFHEGGAAGGLEVYYSTPHAFSEQDVHTCQLMAGLVTEALARDEEHTWKQSLVNERAVMLEALEKLKPNLAALAEIVPHQGSTPAAAATARPNPPYVCAQCGNRLVAGEQFCGQCGTPRGDAASSMQSKVASLLRMQEPKRTETPAVPAIDIPAAANAQEAPEPSRPDSSLASSLEQELPDLFAPIEEPSEESHDAVPASVAPDVHLEAEDAKHADANTNTEEEAATEETALATMPPADWTSAASAREFLEQLAEGKQRGALARFWDTRRGDIYLAIAVILVLCVIRWGIWSNRPVSATNTPPTATAAHHKTAPDAGLSLFDRMLISLGLAEAPEPPEDKGNPSIQVWVDLHTALYYCPGADLYGKTPKGKYATQRDAQLDEYQPAFRKPCN